MASAQRGTQSPSSSQPQSHVLHIASAQFRRPSLDLIQDIKKYYEKCIPLYKLSLRGDWKSARRMIETDNRLLNAAITKEQTTLLHVAAGTNHVHFVEELVKLLNPCDLELQDVNGNNAFCYAAASGNLQIAATMIKKNACLPTIRGGEGATPLFMAVLQGKGEMARFLYGFSVDVLGTEDFDALFFLCIANGFYDLGLQMLQKEPMLALARNENNETGLHVLARKPFGFNSPGQWYLQNQVMNYSNMKQTPYVQLVGCLWNMLLDQEFTETEMRTFISQPSQITFDATETGNFLFVAELVRSYPDLIWEVDAKNRSIFHIAVLKRHSSIFNLLYELGSFKDFIVTFEDDEENNILHYAAKLTPPDKLSLISGAALQMTHELQWFEEVKKIMLPSKTEKRNSNGKTPNELFAEEHKELLSKAESWTKSTANSSMLISTLIATGIFAATFNLPGGSDKTTGIPYYLEKPSFLIFAISDATALITSSASILIFLSILISSYAEENHFKSLPLKLLFGLIAQIISITSMMVAFSVSFFVTYYHGVMWIPNFISVLAFPPIPLFIFLLFQLWSDIFHSSYFCMYLFGARKKMLS